MIQLKLTKMEVIHIKILEKEGIFGVWQPLLPLKYHITLHLKNGIEKEQGYQIQKKLRKSRGFTTQLLQFGQTPAS